jgi:ketosteroid isomerase-like protein
VPPDRGLTAVTGPEDDALVGTDDVERVRHGYEAFANGDIAAVLDFFDPDVEWRMADDEPDARTFHGHQQILQFWAETLDTFEWFRFDLEEVLAVGDRVVAVTRICGRGKGSGVEVDLSESHVLSMRGGKAVRVEEYRTKEQAVEVAAGGGTGG